MDIAPQNAVECCQKSTSQPDVTPLRLGPLSAERTGMSVKGHKQKWLMIEVKRPPDDGHRGHLIARWQRNVDAFLRQLVPDPLELLIVGDRHGTCVPKALELARRVLDVGLHQLC